MLRPGARRGPDRAGNTSTNDLPSESSYTTDEQKFDSFFDEVMKLELSQNVPSSNLSRINLLRTTPYLGLTKRLVKNAGACKFLLRVILCKINPRAVRFPRLAMRVNVKLMARLLAAILPLVASLMKRLNLR